MDGRGFTAETWSGLKTFQGRCATPHDVDLGAAVFALGDTFNGKALDMRLPQPVIWWSDDEDEVGAIAVQAECHETQDGETLEVLGLVLPDGRTAISLLEDCDEVDATDPVWIALVQEAVDDAEDDGDDGDTAWDDDEIYP